MMPSVFDQASLQSVKLAVSRGTRPVLREHSLQFAAGQIWALMGPNGAGKSTLLRCLAGDVGALRCQGEVLLDGRPLARWPARERAQKIAYLPQKPEMPRGLSVLEVALLGASARLAAFAAPSAEDHLRAASALAELQLSELAAREAAALSGGEQQRVHIARIVVQHAPIWLLDEPYGGLDFAQQAALLRRCQAHAARGGLVLLVAHDLFYLPRAASHMALLRGGELLCAGPREQVWSEASAERAFGVPFARSSQPAGLWPAG